MVPFMNEAAITIIGTGCRCVGLVQAYSRKSSTASIAVWYGGFVHSENTISTNEPQHVLYEKISNSLVACSSSSKFAC